MILSYSHGPDSRYLLDLILKATPPDQIILIYFDHGLRPEAKDEIEAIKILSAELGLKCCFRKLPIAGYQRKYGVSFEAAAHSLRKSFLIHFSKLFGKKEVVLGHHLDDDIETMMLKLFRGTGSHWRPFLERTEAYGVTWVRPLLEISKAEILAYLDANQLSYSIDETNADVNYTRNWVRHEFLPQASRINSDYRGALFGFFSIQRKQAIAISAEVDRILSEYCHFSENFVEFSKVGMASISPVFLPHIGVRLLTLAWAYFHRHFRILPPYWGISSVHVSRLCEGLESKMLGRCSLPTDAFSEWNGKSLVIVALTLTASVDVKVLGKVCIAGYAGDEASFGIDKLSILVVHPFMSTF